MSQDNIFREVDEELRSERMRNMWRRYGPLVIFAAVLVVVIVAANEGWSWYQRSQAAQSSDRLYAALQLAETGDVPAAQAALGELAAAGSGGYPTLARFREAALLVENGRTAEAIAAYDALANAQSNAQLRELALVLAANLLVDSGTPADVEARVGGLVETGAMRNAAREALGLAQYKAGNRAVALEHFEAVAADPLAGQETRTRMSIYLAQLVAEGVGDPDAIDIELDAGLPLASEAAAP